MRVIAFCAMLATATPTAADEIEAARKRWAGSPHGPMLERILPPTFDAAQLPEPASEGARLVLRYCVQCHNLPNPAMHDRDKWVPIVQRMVVRMQGKGNMGKLMAEMMAGVKAPTAEETRGLVAYLAKHSQRPLDPKKVPEAFARAGEPFRLACNQCHALPDPARYTAREWPTVVARMQRNMEWMNRVVGSNPRPGEPQLRIEDINAFLAKYARKP
jgi:cytochrome c5